MGLVHTFKQVPLYATNKVLVYGTITGVAADPSASLTPVMLGLQSIDFIVVETDAADNGEDVGLGTIAQYDYTANTVAMLHTGTEDGPLHIAADGDVTDIKVRFMALGTRSADA